MWSISKDNWKVAQPCGDMEMGARKAMAERYLSLSVCMFRFAAPGTELISAFGQMLLVGE